MARLTGSFVDPVKRLHHGAENLRARIERRESIADAPILAVRHRSRNHEGIRAAEGVRQLPQSAEWKNGAAREWTQSIDQHDVQIARQPPMLKTIVQQKNAGMVHLLKQLARPPAIGADSEMRVSRAHEDLSFVSR